MGAQGVDHAHLRAHAVLFTERCAPGATSPPGAGPGYALPETDDEHGVLRVANLVREVMEDAPVSIIPDAEIMLN